MPKTSLRLKSSLPLALLVAAWQFSAMALGQTVIIPLDVVASRSIDGASCMGSEDKKEQPSQDSAPPVSSRDIEDSDSDCDDLSADLSTRNDQYVPHFSDTSVGAQVTRMPRIIPILLFPAHCFYCLHAHIRERAPPIPI